MRTTQRLAAVAAGTALSLAGLTGLAAQPASADPTPAGNAAVAWFTGQLQNGVLGGNCSFYCGPTIDGALSAHVLGDDATLQTVSAAVAADPASYTDYDYYYPEQPDPTAVHYTGRAANGVAKELVLAQTAGANATDFGPSHADLVSRLEALVGVNGRIADDAEADGSPDPFGDYANVIGQSFAAEGLDAAHSPRAAAVTSYLLAQQCPAGYFRFTFPDKAADTPCAADVAGQGADPTAYAVLALEPQLGNPTVKAAVDRAVAWLLGQQAANGSFVSDAGAVNTNSTGLAGWALGSSCKIDAADRAAAFVRSLQVPGTQTGALAAEKGAIAFDAQKFADGQASGISAGARSSWWVATGQASASLNWDPTAPASVAVSVPPLTKAGDPAAATIAGVQAGELVCVTDASGTRAFRGTGAPLVVPVPAPAQGGDVTVTATTGPGRASDTLHALAKTKLKPKVAARVHRGAKVGVKITKLAPNEKVTVYVDGRRVDKGKATAQGVFKGRFVAHLKVGAHRLKVVGQYRDRVGTVSFRVVR